MIDLDKTTLFYVRQKKYKKPYLLNDNTWLPYFKNIHYIIVKVIK